MASMISSAAVATVSRSSPAQASNTVAPFTGLKSVASFPVTRKASNDLTSQLPTNGGRVMNCFHIWPPMGLKKFETLSYLPSLTKEQLSKEIEYLLQNEWIPCLEFQLEELNPFVHRKYNSSPGYYDGRYWTMWKLPMYGCTDPSEVLKEMEEAIKAYPKSFIRIIGFDKKRQVQCVSFVAYKPPGY